MTRPTILRRSATAAFAAALLLSACSSSGGSDSTKKTTTTAAKTTTTAAKTTTTAADDDTSTTSPSGDGPTAAELETVLPAAEEIGAGWTVDTTEQTADTAIETATDEQCPDAGAVLAPAEDGEPTIAFASDKGESLRITLSPGVATLDPADISAVVDSINDCDAVTAEEGGLTFTASFDAAANTDYGDGGIQISAAVNITDGTDSYDVTKYRVRYTVGTTGITITGGDGILDDGTVNPIDPVGLDATATEIATRVGNL